MDSYVEVTMAIGSGIFFKNLLDGDPASNTLSWRWVAGLFIHKEKTIWQQKII